MVICIFRLCQQSPLKKVSWLHLRFIRTDSNYSVRPIYALAESYRDKNAIVDDHYPYTYRDILQQSYRLYKRINNVKKQKFIPFLTSNDASYLIALFAIWMSGNIGKI